MDQPIGIGGFKLQQVISQEMNQMRHSLDPRTSLQMMLSQRSQAQFQQVMDQDVPNEQPLKLLSKKKDKRFQLQVSSASSSFSISSEESSNSQKSIRSTNYLLRQQAAASLKLLVKDNKQQIRIPTIPIRNISNEKKQINFLKGLQQNSELSENNYIDEFYQQGKITVKLKSKDFMTFMRWQHEVEELKRKKRDFDEQKDRHFQLTKGDTITKMEQKKNEEIMKKKKNRYSESWIVGISLAKRFLRIGRKRARVALQRNAIKTLTGIQSVPHLSDSNRSDDVRSMASFREIQNPQI
ncbi:unnamed protein product [Paramecium sonneborni]|uniref:Uncharacterized protein n=1 Tax=Paramecium sonneborni TaxID=65129 RepID=A0A8S1PQ67_9CILI|nr:unnamed protein product [Paramecium sonneborni]